MILNRKQIQQLAMMAGFEVKDISDSSLEEEFQLYHHSNDYGTVTGLVACSSEYPEDLSDFLIP